MSYFFRNINLLEGIRSVNECNYPKIKLFLITKSELRATIKERKLASIDIIETSDNFGILYSAKVNLFSSDDMLNISIYLLASRHHQVLYYKTINNLLISLRSCGYRCSKRDLNIISYFSGF
jgi:hypothetical protein